MFHRERQLIDGERISIIPNILSADECQQLIARAEESGFKLSPPSGGGHGRTHREDPRTNEYTVINDQSLADKLFKRVSPLLPPTLEWMADNAYFTKGIGGREWSIVGCVDRLRFYKYKKDEEYPEHMDGSYSRTITYNNELQQSYKQHSFLTLLIYLNDDFQGGETKFFPDKQHCRFLRDIENKQPVHVIKPKQGMALINIHNILHEGSKVQSGIKYVLRTDILYQKITELHPKLEKYSQKNSNNNDKIIVTEWEKHFEPSCKMYHD
ncbi:unnamed protein product [Rotaria sordida]|uniref:Fe2OG dioxygenase domain-containing protein n=2 Tax=Rotaria sordida TaxID=392033 RepID=A0A813WNU3_9BILA|nr:unnamed protein product [Rotaria sordida]CAF0832956.1 unnamed protein product [Rotaria sordida]CAF0844302.1 unnamed protein product [Rotaria sordida]CAF0864055.1 unnamed protein product [Rotaria sordida]CAF0875342.1 unnamed protein product [Rotaria sordida]